MSDSPRLAELRRQRALIHEHLAWLDRQIAAEDAIAALGHGTTPAMAALSPSVPSQPVAPVAPNAVEPSTDDPDALLSEYRAADVDVVRHVRTGCLLYFVAALALVAVIVAILYFALRR